MASFNRAAHNQGDIDQHGGVIFRDNRYIAPMIRNRHRGLMRKYYKWELRRHG